MPGDWAAPLSPDEFRSPGVEFRAVTLWMLNDRLEPAELRRQLRGFRDAGWGRVITRTFDGLMTAYLSEDWMRALDAIIREAHDLGMRVWLQAGHMPNGIPDLPEELEYCAVSERGEGQAIEASETLLLRDGNHAYVQGRLPHVLDLLNPRAVETYLERSYEQTWFRRFGEHFGRTIEAIWVDEPCLQPGRLPYGPQVLEAFRARWGGGLAELLPTLFRRVGEWRRARHRYWRTVLDLFVAGYFEPVQRWCREHGVPVHRPSHGRGHPPRAGGLHGLRHAALPVHGHSRHRPPDRQPALVARPAGRAGAALHHDAQAVLQRRAPARAEPRAR